MGSPRRQGLYVVYKWYILPIGGLYATYHPLQEPEKSVDASEILIFDWE